MHGTLHPRQLPAGFPPPRCTAYPHAGYEGAYVWSAYWHTWDKIIGVRVCPVTGLREWIVQEVGNNGVPTGPVRKHCTALDRRGVYPAPFDPYQTR